LNVETGKRPGLTEALIGFFAELKRRRVLHAGGAYIAGAWLGAEILQFLFAEFHAPVWTYRLLAIVLVVGFPLSVILAWVVQFQEDGTWALDPERGDYRTVLATVALGVAITAGLAWLIIPERTPDSPFEPVPDSIAVIPFGAPADNLYRELVEGLRQSREVRVIELLERPGVADPADVGEQLRAEFLAWTRVDGDGLQIDLVDVVNDSVLWQTTYSDEPAMRIVNDLLAALGHPPLSPESFMGTTDISAYEAWLLAESAEDFEKLVARDPAYARAHVGLAEALVGDYGLALEERARSAVDTALALDPESADAMSLYGLGSEIRPLRVQAFERAIELDPGHHRSFYRYAMEMKKAGELHVAEQLIRQALLFAPQDRRYCEALDEIVARNR
jgi:hypothetical protein